MKKKDDIELEIEVAPAEEPAVAAEPAAAEPAPKEKDEMPSLKEEVAEALNAEDIFALAEKTLKDAADKPVVIADEPTALLTPELTMCMIELLRQQAKAGKTVLIASRKTQVIDYADQVIRLEKR